MWCHGARWTGGRAEKKDCKIENVQPRVLETLCGLAAGLHELRGAPMHMACTQHPTQTVVADQGCQDRNFTGMRHLLSGPQQADGTHGWLCCAVLKGRGT